MGVGVGVGWGGWSGHGKEPWHGTAETFRGGAKSSIQMTDIVIHSTIIQLKHKNSGGGQTHSSLDLHKKEASLALNHHRKKNRRKSISINRTNYRQHISSQLVGGSGWDSVSTMLLIKTKNWNNSAFVAGMEEQGWGLGKGLDYVAQSSVGVIHKTTTSLCTNNPGGSPFRRTNHYSNACEPIRVRQKAAASIQTLQEGEAGTNQAAF